MQCLRRQTIQMCLSNSISLFHHIHSYKVLRCRTTWPTTLVWSAGPVQVSLGGGPLSPFLPPCFLRPLCPRVLEVLVFFQLMGHSSFHSELKETNLRFSHHFSGQMGSDLFERKWARQMTEWEIPEERGMGPDSRTSPRSTHASSSVWKHWWGVHCPRAATPHAE